ncbi:hypothetical protein KXD40_007471 [Peronospora effusa]|nr:hypothetical protein KXD40_007471 [Peronospora effusa]
MRLSLYLLLVTLTCIACDSIVASSKDLIQIKTLDANSPRERTDGIHRNLREGVVEDDIADVEERNAFSFGKLGFNFENLMPKVQNAALKMSKETKVPNAFVNYMKQIYEVLVSKFKKLRTKPHVKETEFTLPSKRTRLNKSQLETIPEKVEMDFSASSLHRPGKVSSDVLDMQP